MIKINAKELVLKEIARHNFYKSLTKQEKINEVLESMKFNLKMYNKYKEKKNYTRYDKKSLNRNQWYLIENIEYIKRGS